MPHVFPPHLPLLLNFDNYVFADIIQQEMDYVNVGTPGGLNGFQRLLVHQLVRSEFPTYRTFSRSRGEFMQVEKADAATEAKVGSPHNSSTVLTILRSPSQN